MYIFFANIATKQYNIGTPIITDKNFIGTPDSPINAPKGVDGTISAITLKSIDEKYTNFDALLSINGFFAVLIICIPTRFDITPYENHILWNIQASRTPYTNHNNANTIKSKHELSGPINSIKFFNPFIFHFLGLSK